MEGGEAALKWACKGSSPSSLLEEDLLESALYPAPCLSGRYVEEQLGGGVTVEPGRARRERPLSFLFQESGQ